MYLSPPLSLSLSVSLFSSERCFVIGEFLTYLPQTTDAEKWWMYTDIHVTTDKHDKSVIICWFYSTGASQISENMYDFS